MGFPVDNLVVILLADLVGIICVGFEAVVTWLVAGRQPGVQSSERSTLAFRWVISALVAGMAIYISTSLLEHRLLRGEEALLPAGIPFVNVSFMILICRLILGTVGRAELGHTSGFILGTCVSFIVSRGH